MRALSTSLLALCTAAPLWADDFHVQMPVAAATVYPQGAELVRRASLDLPAGEHRVFLPYASPGQGGALPRIRTAGDVTIGALDFLNEVATDPEILFTEAQRTAKARIDALETQIEAQEDLIASAHLKVEALRAEQEFYGAVRPPEDAATPESLTALAELVRSRTEAALQAMSDGEREVQRLEKELGEIMAEFKAALHEFERLSPPEEVNDMLVLTVTAASAGPASFELTELVHEAGWHLDYDMYLGRSDAPTLAVQRNLVVSQWTGEIWNGVDLVLSTARPGGAIAPSEVHPDKAEIYEPSEYDRSGRMAGGMAPLMLEGAEEMPVMAPAAITTAELRVDGLAISYVYPEKVTIGSDEAAQLALDRLAYPAETAVHAAPRRDETAFLVATFTNDRAEPILPGMASFHRDGQFVGRQDIKLIPAGGEATLPFGPIEGLRLKTVFARNETGDAGIITRSNTRDQIIAFSVENLTGQTQAVRAFFPLPFSEQEDLKIALDVRPRADETDVDDKRGVSAWDLSVAPGATATVRIGVTLSWPEDFELNWNP